MAIFLDSGKIEQVEKFLRWGVIRGVTTNPTILLKDGVTGGAARHEKAGPGDSGHDRAPTPVVGSDQQ